MILAEGSNAEVHTSVDLIRIPVVDDAFDGFDLFDNVAGGGGFDGGAQDVEDVHHVMEVVGVALHHLHGLQVFETRLFPDFVFTVVRVTRQMAHIRDVANVPHFVAEVLQVAIDDVEGQKGPNVAQVHVAVYRGATHVHPHKRGIDGLEFFFGSGQAVADVQGVHGSLFKFESRK